MFLLLSFWTKPVFSASEASVNSSENRGRISFEKTLSDFGTVKRGDKLKAKFDFTNVGHGPLMIQGIQSSCDCITTDTFKGKSWQPGETGSIEVVFDTRDYLGKITKVVTVITNERSQPDRTLTITAMVNADLIALPPLADFGEVFLGKSATQEVRVRNTSKKPLKIERVKFNQDFLDVGYIAQNQEWVVTITMKQNVPIGFFKDTVLIKTNSTSLPELPIPVRASVKGPIASSPTYIEFGSIANKEKSNRTISLSGVGPFKVLQAQTEFHINGTKVQNADQIVKVTLNDKDATSQTIQVELQNPGEKSGSVHGKITLNTSHDVQKNIVMDFYAFFR
jgi:hypothetical protein